MAYTPNPKRAELFLEALNKGVEAFEKIQEETRNGFTRPLILQIMRPVWPYFEQQLPEDVEAFHESLEELLEDFWEEYDYAIFKGRVEFPKQEPIKPSYFFSSCLSEALHDEALYDKLIILTV